MAPVSLLTARSTAIKVAAGTLTPRSRSESTSNGRSTNQSTISYLKSHKNMTVLDFVTKVYYRSFMEITRVGIHMLCMELLGGWLGTPKSLFSIQADATSQPRGSAIRFSFKLSVR